jgi:hypothetical protein
MTVEEPAEPDKKSIDEWLLEHTNATPEGLEQAKKEAEKDARRHSLEESEEENAGG